jgi:hypothetical protein
VRLTRSHDPWVRAAWIDGKRVSLPDPICLSVFVAQHANRRMDLDVEYERDQGKRLVGFRVVVLPSKEKSMTRLAPTCLAPRSRLTSSRASTASAGKSSYCSRSGSRTQTSTNSIPPTSTSRRGSSGPACVPRCSSASWPTPPNLSAASPSQHAAWRCALATSPRRLCMCRDRFGARSGLADLGCGASLIHAGA